MTKEWNTKQKRIFRGAVLAAAVLMLAAALFVGAGAATDVTVTFDSNGGSGSMTSQDVQSGKATALKLNTFDAPGGKSFQGWNIESDGSGVGYTDGAKITITTDTTLYAMWDTVNITFNGNGATSGTMEKQTIGKGVPTALSPNLFDKTNCVFYKWNTDSAGSGINYANKASVTLTSDTDLYAQWTAELSWLSAGVSTPAQLQEFAALVNSGVTFEGKTVKLSADIDLSSVCSEVSGVSWTPIGNATNKFWGTFDGQNHAVSNLYISSTEDYQGLFGRAQSAVFKSVTLNNAHVTGNNFVGSLIGMLHSGIEEYSVDGCSTNNVYVNTTGAQIGGLVGLYESEATRTLSRDCHSSGTVSGKRTVGGLFGNCQAIVYDSSSSCSVNVGAPWGVQAPGASIGGVFGSGYIAYNCFATGDVNLTVVDAPSRIDGIAGFAGDISRAEKCYSTGNVTVNADNSTVWFVGGFAGGQMAGAHTVSDCFSTGNVSVTSINTPSPSGGNTAIGHIGGLIGFDNNPVNNSYTTGRVSVYSDKTGIFLGGLVGKTGDTINKNYCLALNPSISSSNITSVFYLGSNPTGSQSAYPNCYVWKGLNKNGQYPTDSSKFNLVDSVDFWDNQSFFEELGWDFTNTWEMSSAETFKLPILKGMAAPSSDASHLKPVTVTFDTRGGSDVSDQKITKGFNATRPADPTKTGYAFENWYNESECTGVFNFEAMLTADTTAYANWTAVEYNNTVSGDNNVTYPAGLAVGSIKFNTGSEVTAVAFKYGAPNGNPQTSGAAVTTVGDPFTLTPTGSLNGTKAVVNFNITDTQMGSYNTADIRLAHYVSSAWTFIVPTFNDHSDGNYTFSAEVDSMSPFGIVHYAANPAPAPQSSSSHSSSRNDGYSVWLQETAQPTPTPVPTAEPTQAAPVASPVKPQPTQTSASPAPFVGILAGLGAAAVLFGLRRT